MYVALIWRPLFVHSSHCLLVSWQQAPANVAAQLMKAPSEVVNMDAEQPPYEEAMVRLSAA